MHGLYTSTQHLDETLEPLNWIRVRPSHRDKHSCEHSHVLYYVSCNMSKYMPFKPNTCPSFCIFLPSNSSHLNINKSLYFWLWIQKNIITHMSFKDTIPYSIDSYSIFSATKFNIPILRLLQERQLVVDQKMNEMKTNEYFDLRTVSQIIHWIYAEGGTFLLEQIGLIHLQKKSLIVTKN